MGREKVKGLSVLSLEVEKDFCDVWTSLRLHLTFSRLRLNALTANDCLLGFFLGEGVCLVFRFLWGWFVCLFKIQHLQGCFVNVVTHFGS